MMRIEVYLRKMIIIKNNTQKTNFLPLNVKKSGSEKRKIRNLINRMKIFNCNLEYEKLLVSEIECA